LITGFQFTVGIVRFVIAGFTVMADTAENIEEQKLIDLFDLMEID